MKKLITILTVMVSFASFAATYRLELIKDGESTSGFYYGKVLKADNKELSEVVKIYPTTKDVYYALKRYSKGNLVEIEGTDEPDTHSNMDKVNAIAAQPMYRVPTIPRRDRR